MLYLNLIHNRGNPAGVVEDLGQRVVVTWVGFAVDGEQTLALAATCRSFQNADFDSSRWDDLVTPNHDLNGAIHRCLPSSLIPFAKSLLLMRSRSKDALDSPHKTNFRTIPRLC